MLKFFVRISTVCALFVQAANAQVPYKWSNVAMGGGGFVSGIITSKEQAGLMYMRTDVGGAYRWDSAGNAWVPLTDWASENQQGMFGVESMAIDPQQPNVLYVSAGISYFNNGKSYILRSVDYGANFTIIDVTAQFKMHGNGMGRQNGEKLQVDPNNSTILYCGSRYNGLFKSTNSGDTWTRLAGLNVTTTPNENGLSFVLPDRSSVSAGASKRIFVGISRTGNDQNLYKTEDGGTTFAALVNPNLAAALMPQRAVLSENGNLYITYGNGAGPSGITAEPYDKGEIWKYNVAGGTWTNVTPAGVNRAFCGISIDPTNSNRLVTSTTNTYSLQYNNVYGDKFFISTNGGSSWTDIVTRGFSLDAASAPWLSGQSIHWAGSIEFDPSNTKKVWVVSGNGIFLNEDIDASTGTWKVNVKGLEETVPRNLVSIPGGPIVSVISDYDGFTQNDPAQYAANRHTPTMGSTTGLDYAAGIKTKVVRIASSMYYSNDMGLTWIKAASLNGSNGQVALSADGNTFIHCPSGSAITYRSVNNGTTWAAVTGLTFSDVRPVADGSNSAKFYAYNNTNGSFLTSSDGGATFTAAASLGSGGSRIIRTIPGREGHIWLAGGNGGLSRSVNSGAAFTKINGVTACTAVGIGKALFAGSYETIFIWGTINGITGAYRSTDEGLGWTQVNDDAHEYGGLGNGQFIVGDMNVYGRVYLSSAGRGIAVGEAVSAPNGNPLGFTLPVTNFKVQAINESCSVNNDGKIVITAVQSLNYKASVTSNGTTADYPFTGNLEVGPLVAGNYAVCITVTGQPAYRQCFDVAVTEPPALSVYATTNLTNRLVNLSLQGASVYHVQLNGKEFSTVAGTINLKLEDGWNQIDVRTDKNCQGTFKRTIFAGDKQTVYPNPFTSLVNISMGDDTSKTALLSVYSITGELLWSKNAEPRDQPITADLTSLQGGTYILKIKTSLGTTSSRIIKK